MDILFLIPLNEIDATLLSYLRRGLEERFKFNVSITERVSVPSKAFDQRRQQYHSTLILKYIIEHLPTDAEKALGIADVDLYAPGLNFVFGEADLGGQGAVISVTRLRQEFYNHMGDAGLFFQRVLKEAVHEVGHMLGLGHCSDDKCVMYFSNSLADTDRKFSFLCSKCAIIADKMTVK